MKKTLIIVISNNLVESIREVRAEEAQQEFLAQLSTRISNFDEYGPDDISAVLEKKCEKFGNGSVSVVEL